MVKSYYYLYVFYVCNILLFIILYNIYYTDEKKIRWRYHWQFATNEKSYFHSLSERNLGEIELWKSAKKYWMGRVFIWSWTNIKYMAQ